MANSQVEARHYAFLVFLTLLNVMNFVDRQLLASFANFIVPDLGLTNAEFGLLTGLAFITFYVVMGLFMGMLADMVHRPRLVAVGLLLWSALTAISGTARGFWSLAVPRMFIGVGESILTPTSMSMLADRFPNCAARLCRGFLLHGRADRRRRQSADRRVSRADARLAQLLLPARRDRSGAGRRDVVRQRDAAPPRAGRRGAARGRICG